jgi:hypothetical protein
MRFQLPLLTGLMLLSVILIPGTAAPYFDRALPLKGGASPSATLGKSAGSPTAAVRGQVLADVLRIESATFMGCASCAATISATPKPISLLLFGITLAGIGLILRRRLRRTGAVDRT